MRTSTSYRTMKRILAAVAPLAMLGTANAGVYKCQNITTGKITYQSSRALGTRPHRNLPYRVNRLGAGRSCGPRRSAT